MGEFWVRDLHPRLMYYQDVRGAASAGHVYGKNVVAAESFTGGGFESPYTLKKVADYWFAQGINRLVFHTSAHQPLDTPPGNTMVGTHLHRNITWAEQAKPFMTYVARTSFLLQQGKSVADLAYLLDEGAPSTMPIWGNGLKNPPPDGYDFDYVNSDVVLNRLSIGAEGRLTCPTARTTAFSCYQRPIGCAPNCSRKSGTWFWPERRWWGRSRDGRPVFNAIRKPTLRSKRWPAKSGAISTERVARFEKWERAPWCGACH